MPTLWIWLENITYICILLKGTLTFINSSFFNEPRYSIVGSFICELVIWGSALSETPNICLLYANTVKPPCATTSRKRPCNSCKQWLFQNTKISPVKSLCSEPLVSDHLSSATATTSGPLVWNFLLFLTSGNRPFHMIWSHYLCKLGNERPYNPEMTIKFVVLTLPELFISDSLCSLYTIGNLSLWNYFRLWHKI